MRSKPSITFFFAWPSWRPHSAFSSAASLYPPLAFVWLFCIVQANLCHRRGTAEKRWPKVAKSGLGQRAKVMTKRKQRKNYAYF